MWVLSGEKGKSGPEAAKKKNVMEIDMEDHYLVGMANASGGLKFVEFAHELKIQGNPAVALLQLP